MDRFLTGDPSGVAVSLTVLCDMHGLSLPCDGKIRLLMKEGISSLVARKLRIGCDEVWWNGDN